MGRKKPKEVGGGIGEWVVTYGDMVTLLLCFFVALFDTTEMDASQMSSVAASVQALGLGTQEGGKTLSQGKLAELGNTVASLPSMEKGRSLAQAEKKAISLFNPEIKSNKIRISVDQRGLVISLAADAYFSPGTADVNLEAARNMLGTISELLKSSDLDLPNGEKRSFRVEGHTDSSPIDPDGRWPSNWELSTQRAINVLHYLTDFGVAEKQFQIAGFSDTVPLADNATPEGRAYNRRVDIIILDPGHL